MNKIIYYVILLGTLHLYAMHAPKAPVVFQERPEMYYQTVSLHNNTEEPKKLFLWSAPSYVAYQHESTRRPWTFPPELISYSEYTIEPHSITKIVDYVYPKIQEEEHIEIGGIKKGNNITEVVKALIAKIPTDQRKNYEFNIILGKGNKVENSSVSKKASTASELTTEEKIEFAEIKPKVNVIQGRR
jgi:hypothetical protein